VPSGTSRQSFLELSEAMLAEDGRDVLAKAKRSPSALSFRLRERAGAESQGVSDFVPEPSGS
jgi:hypothetical protein